MARTPRTRGGARTEPKTNDAAPEDGPRTEAPAEFAASESLIPAENAEAALPAERMEALLEPPASPTEAGQMEPSESVRSLAELTASPVEAAPEAGEAPAGLAVSGPPGPAEETEAETPVADEAPRSAEDARSLAEPPASPADAAPGNAEATAAFAASESLTPGENADLPEPPAAESVPGPLFSDGADRAADAPRPDTEAPPEAAPASDAFRFADAVAPPLAASEEARVADTLSGPFPALSAEANAAEPERQGIAAAPAALQTETPPYERAYDRAQPTPPPAQRGGGALFTAGLLGGLAALLLAGLLQGFGFLPTLGSSSGNNGEALQSEIEGLRTEVASLRAAGSAPAADPALASAVDALQADVAQLKSAGPATAAVPPELETRLAAAEEKLGGLNGMASAEELAALSGRVSEAETLAQTNAGALEQATARVGEASTRIDALEQNFSGVQSGVSGLQASVAELQKGVEALQAQPRVALAIAASALKEATDRGAPFTAELATLGTLAPDAPEIGQLQAYAEAGVPTRPALLAEWNGTVDAVLATENPPDADAGLMGRLMSGAESLVSVRPIGAVEGEGVSAIVGRMQAAMEAGDLDKAMAEYDTLPDAAKQAAAGFAEHARARLAVERLVGQAIANATKAT